MASGNEDGYTVPLQLHPHTEALTALLMPDGAEASGPHEHAFGRDYPPFTYDQSQQGADQQRGSSARLGMWVSPPALVSLRDHAKQLQHQKRTKQRQQVVADANPGRFELPRELQRPGDQLQDGEDGTRSYQLIGVNDPHASAAAPPLRRERDGGVLVPLRMMASLVIKDGAAAGVAGASAAGGGLIEQQQPQQQGRVQQQSGLQPELRLRPTVGLQGAALEGPAAPPLGPPSGSGPRAPPEATTEETQRGRGVAAQHLQGSPAAREPLPPSQGMDLGAAEATSPAAAKQRLSMEPDSPHRHSQHRHGPPRYQAYPEQSPPPPQHQHQHQLPQPPQHQPHYPGALSLRPQAGAGPPAGDVAAQADDDGDGAMLIDVGSGDRTAEGALLPTPDRPRLASSASGWDALRGLGMQEAAGQGASAGGVAATLALLSVGPQPMAATAANAELDGRNQQAGVMEEDVGAAPEAQQASGSAGHGRQQRQLQLHREPPPDVSALLAGHAAGRLAGEEADEGFDADDEGETARREERARAAFRIGGRSAKFRPLPGLSTTPPWSAHSFGSLVSERGDLPGTSFGLDPAALATTLSASEAMAQQQGHVQAGRVSSLDARLMALAGQGGGGGSGGLAGGGMIDGELDPSLIELLKLKCSLRRAVQNNNTQAMGLILSLLAALPATPALLADSQAAALVSPLQQHANTQVAAAARHLLAVWKGVLKAAARQPIASCGPLGPGAVSRGDNPSGGPATGQERSGGGLPPPFPHHHHHHGPPHRSHTGVGSGLIARGRSNPRVWDVPLRDQAQVQIHFQPPGASEGMQPPELHFGVLSLARSQSDALADGFTAAASAATDRQPGARCSPLTAFKVSALAGYTLAPPAGPVGATGTGASGQAQAQMRAERARGAQDWESPSGSRSPTEADAGPHSSGEETHEEGGGVAGVDAAVVAMTEGVGRQPQDLEGLTLGGGNSGGGGDRASTGTESLHARVGMPLSSAVSGGGGGGGSGGDGGAKTSKRAPAVGTLAAHCLATPITLPPLRETVGLLAPGALPSPSMPTPGGDGVRADGVRDKDVCGNFTSSVPTMWRQAVSASGCVLPSGELVTGSDGLAAALRSPASMAVAVGPPTPAALILVPPQLAQPTGRKRKVERERPSSRRRSANPSKRAAASNIAGQYAGPRPVHPALPLSLGMDAAAGSPSDDQRPQPSQPPHGPVTGLKNTSRSSLLALHAPHSKRQRHHAGGAAGQHGGNGCHTATQVRRMSLLLSSLDLGGAAGEGADARPEKVLAAMEGDVDADADMGSQDDEEAMLTSEDEGPASTNGAGGGGSGTVCGHEQQRGDQEGREGSGGRQDGSGPPSRSLLERASPPEEVILIGSSGRDAVVEGAGGALVSAVRGSGGSLTPSLPALPGAAPVAVSAAWAPLQPPVIAADSHEGRNTAEDTRLLGFLNPTVQHRKDSDGSGSALQQQTVTGVPAVVWPIPASPEACSAVPGTGDGANGDTGGGAGARITSGEEAGLALV